MMRRCTRSVLSAALCLLLCFGARADDLDAIRALIGEIKVSVEHESELVKSPDAAKPPLQSDAWRFVAGGVNPTVRYSRYLSRPPEFTGTHPSLANPDMGIGLDGGPFGNWYRGNAIRLLLDGHDVFAERPANRLESKEGPQGHLLLLWELEAGRRVALCFTVPRDGRAVFCRIGIEPGETPISGLEVRLTAYPGGFGPAYGLPSHRFVRTTSAAARVPPGFAPTAEQPFPVVPLTEADDWVLYGDGECSSGSLALLMSRDEGPTGHVDLSNYGVMTSLTYPPNTRYIRLGFYAFSTENDPAQRSFLAGLAGERAALATVPFWAGE